MKQLVYAMRDRNTQLVKIGIATNPNTRITGIEKQFQADVELLGTLEVEDAKNVEIFLHSTLAQHRVIGEWFQPDAKTLSYVLAFFVKPPTLSKAPKTKKALEPLTYKADPSHPMEVIRHAVRARLGALNWNRSKLATLTGLHKQTVSDLLNGKNEGKIDTWQKILEVLDLELIVRLKGEPKE